MQVLHNNMVVEIEHPIAGLIKVVGHPVKFSKTVPKFTLPPPNLGEHTQQILNECGYSNDDIEELKRQKVL